MSPARTIVAAAFCWLAAPAAVASGALGDYCVGIERAGCTAAPTLTAALARPGRVRVFLGPGSYTADARDAGVPVQLVGAGIDDTVLREVELRSSGSKLSDASVDRRLLVAGRAERVEARGGAELVAGARGTVAQLAQTVVEDRILVRGPAQLDDVDLGVPAAVPVALEVQCATALVRHLTVRDDPRQALRADCARAGAQAAVELRSSVLPGADPVQVSGRAHVTSAYSRHARDRDVVATNRLDPGQSVVDAGDPAPLAPYEPFEDAAGDTRVTDGDGDGTVRRDVGAYERQPPAPAPPEANVLADPGAEAAGTGADGAPPGWSGTFTTAAYGDPFLPSRRAGEALGAGAAFFTAGTRPDAQLLQRIDVADAARGIDTGRATAALQALLGGYGADPDVVTVVATFRDPEGYVLGAFGVGPVTADERGRDTNLLLRANASAIPARTRAVDVTIHGQRRAGSYTDAYADDVSLVLTVPGVEDPGVPVPPPVQATDPVVPDLQPFAGVTVMTARPVVSRRGRMGLWIACPTATVGRCSGTLELRARALRRAAGARVAPVAAFTLGPGQAREVRLRLVRAARRALRHRGAAPARLLTTATDGQGVQRRRTVPLRLRARLKAPAGPRS